MNSAVKGNSSAEVYMHAEFKRAFDQCKGFAELAEPGSLCTCVGASGAGKSELAKIIGPAIYGDSETWRDGERPYILVTADNPERGYFSPKELTHSILSALDDPFRASPLRLAENGMDNEFVEALRGGDVRRSRSTSEPVMRQVVEDIAPHKRLALIIVDEANMLALTQRNRIPTDYLEGLRILGKKAGCRILLLGTVDLLLFGNYSAQLNRSEIRVHLNRMRCEDEKGKAEFAALVGKLANKWKVSAVATNKDIALMYDWTYGVPGEVDQRFKLAAIRCWGCSEQIGWADVRDCKPSKEEIERIRVEADIIQAVMDDVPLSVQQTKALKRRKRGQMNPRRVQVKASS
jgi:energy-coupling factor transporter ATP-binding protein EcfA2